MSYILKYSKFLVVLQWDEIKSLDSRWVSTIAPMIVEARDGNILDTDDIISNSSELYIKRCAYDAHGCMYIQETKMTSDCAILGPISDHDEILGITGIQMLLSLLDSGIIFTLFAISQD